jgi:protoporphyrinogen oxidase
MNSPVILGAGPAGLAAAWAFAGRKTNPHILEKEAVTGGLAHTFEDGGYHFDLGPHILHPKYPEISEFIQRIIGPELRKLDIRAQILFRGRFVNYPFKGIRVLTSLPLRAALPAGLNFIWARARLLRGAAPDDSSFQEWITRRFGAILYSIYFGPYAEKVWKIPGNALSAYVAQKRVPVVSIRDLLRHMLHLTPKNVHHEDGHLDMFYSRHGVGQLCDALVREIAESGATLSTRCAVRAIVVKERTIRSVQYAQSGIERELPADALISTIPLPALIQLMKTDAPPVVIEAASGLDYCAQRLIYLKIRRPTVPIPPILYLSDPAIRFNRIFNVGAFSADCVPAGRSGLCIEFTCNEGDDIWSCDADVLAAEVLQVLKRFALLNPADIEGSADRRIAQAYPRFRVGFQNRLDIILRYLGTIKNLRTVGRQGLFNYANIDDAMHMGFAAARELT